MHTESPEIESKLVFAAIVASLFFHIVLLIVSGKIGVGFGAPVVDPISPKRFKLERVWIDPKKLEVEKTPQLPSQVRDFQKEPNNIPPFEGPVDAPHLPEARIQSEVSMSLSAAEKATPVDAFSALPVESSGNLTQLSQALSKEATTAALQEVSKSLKASSLAGGAGGGGSVANQAGSFSKVEDLSALLTKRASVPALERPAFQPILLRLSSDVLFEFDSAEIQSPAIPMLERVAVILSEAVQCTITIEGHTDTIGEDGYNQRLSLARAQSVADWLSAHVKLAHPLAVKGFGKTHPLVNPNGNAEEQKANRRVEIRIQGEK